MRRILRKLGLWAFAFSVAWMPFIFMASVLTGCIAGDDAQESRCVLFGHDISRGFFHFYWDSLLLLPVLGFAIGVLLFFSSFAWKQADA